MQAETLWQKQKTMCQQGGSRGALPSCCWLVLQPACIVLVARGLPPDEKGKASSPLAALFQLLRDT